MLICLKHFQIHSIKTSDVIKLYQHRISVMKQTEAWLKNSLDNASKEISQSNYQINSLNCESMQLNQMLLDNYQAIDELTTENSQLKNKIDKVTEELSTTSHNFAQVNIILNYISQKQFFSELASYVIYMEVYRP